MGVDPISLALIAATTLSSFQGYQSEQASAKAQERSNAAAMRQAQEESRLIKEDAVYAANKERQEAQRLRSQQIMQFMKSGVTLDGSPLLTLQETEEESEQNIENILQNANSRARSARLRGQASQGFVQQADLFGAVARPLGAAAGAGAFRGGGTNA